MQCGRRTNGYVALFVFAALVGLLGQTVVPWLSDQLNSPHLGFRFLVSDIDIYPFVVVALITFRNTEPKRAFWRVLVFFSGLCLGYYGYTAALAAYSALESGSAGYLANVLSSAKDALEYMAVALCAGAWGVRHAEERAQAPPVRGDAGSVHSDYHGVHVLEPRRRASPVAHGRRGRPLPGGDLPVSATQGDF